MRHQDEVFFFEQLLKEAIQEKNEEKIKEIMFIIYSLEKPLLALHALQSLKNYYIRLCCLLESCFILGGLSSNIVHETVKQWIIEIDKRDSVENVSKYFEEIVKGCVALIRDGKTYKHTRTIDLATAYIKNNIQMNFTLEEVASHLYVSSAYLSALFKKEIGINFVDYVNEMKITSSLKYVRYTDETILEISQQFGFCNQSYYTVLFKKMIKETPLQHRKRFRNSEQMKEKESILG